MPPPLPPLAHRESTVRHRPLFSPVRDTRPAHSPTAALSTRVPSPVFPLPSAAKSIPSGVPRPPPSRLPRPLLSRSAWHCARHPTDPCHSCRKACPPPAVRGAFHG